MRNLIFSFLFGLLPAQAFAEQVLSLEQDPQSGTWNMTVQDWNATLSVLSSDDMTATLELRSNTTRNEPPMIATVDMMGPNLPLLVNIEEVFVCGDEPNISVTTADLTPQGEYGVFVYRRFVFSKEHGALGEVVDTASAAAGGALPAAVVSEALEAVCDTN